MAILLKDFKTTRRKRMNHYHDSDIQAMVYCPFDECTVVGRESLIKERKSIYWYWRCRCENCGGTMWKTEIRTL